MIFGPEILYAIIFRYLRVPERKIRADIRYFTDFSHFCVSHWAVDILNCFKSRHKIYIMNSIKLLRIPGEPFWLIIYS